MDYEKKYKEAIERASKLRVQNPFDTVSQMMEHVFPELAESKDELTWLTRFIKEEAYSLSMDIRDNEDRVKLKKLQRSLAWLEKQGKQENLCDKCRKEHPFHSCQDITELGKCYIEAINTSSNKVKPKFHEGDWITNGDYTWKIVGVKPLDYILQSQDGNIVDETISHVDEQFHSFTIEDAKDGDVLSDGTTIFIFKDLLSDGSVMSYCDYDTDSGESDAFCPLSMNLMFFKITPATKEQRDALEKEMNDAGYTFNFEKKELKKVENENYDGEEYGIDSLFHAQRILEKTLGKVTGYQSDDGILEHKCAISAVKKLCGQKPAWSEEDKELCQDALDAFEALANDLNPLEDWGKLYNWLKSIKQRLE